MGYLGRQRGGGRKDELHRLAAKPSTRERNPATLHRTPHHVLHDHRTEAQERDEQQDGQLVVRQVVHLTHTSVGPGRLRSFDERERALGEHRAIAEVAHDVGARLAIHEQGEVRVVGEGVEVRVGHVHILFDERRLDAALAP